MELIGALLFVFIIVRFNSVDDLNITSRLFSQLRIWIPPQDADVERIKKPLPKKGEPQAAGGGGGKATKRPGKGNAAAAGGKEAAKGMAAADRVEALNLRQALIAQGMLTRLPDFGTLDRIVLLVVIAWFMTFWQELYRLAHPAAWLFRIGTTFTALAAVLILAALLSLVHRRFLRARSLAATTADFASSLIYSTAILSLITASLVLLLPPQHTTFHLDSAVVQHTAQRCYTWARDLLGASFGLDDATKSCPTALAARILLVLTAALVAVAHVPSAWLASFAFVHRPRLPPRARGNALQQLFVFLDPALSCLLCLTYLRPVSLGLLERLGLAVAEQQWLYMQAGLLALLILGRLSLVRWQLQTYLEYGAVLALYEELASRGKPEEIDNWAVRMLFQLRIQRLPLMGLELLAPIAWLSILLLLLLSKCFLPVWLGALAEKMMPQEAAEAFFDRAPKLNATALQVLEQLRQPDGGVEYHTVHATVHALWDFEWADPAGWASLVGFFVWWSVGAYTGLYVLSIAYRLVGQGGVKANV